MELREILEESKSFMNQFATLHLASCDHSGQPEASYAPYIRDGMEFYVYVSKLSKHTENIEQNPKVSFLFIAAEQDSKQLFARQRLTFTAEALLIARDSEKWLAIMDRFAEKFGNIIEMLRDLQDFRLFALTPKEGNYVRGFAQAYRLSGDMLDDIKHRNEQGHQHKSI